MKISMRRLFSATVLAAGVALVVAACGGGSGDQIGTKRSFSKVYVMGDSLADVGTFGFKFTVQNSADPKGFPIWTQLVAANYGVTGQCNFYTFTGMTFAANPTPGCTNYAIGGGRVVVSAANGGAANPQTVGTQLATKAAAGNYTSADLVLIDGGGNDAADLVSAYLGTASGAAGVTNYVNFLSQQLDMATITATLPLPTPTASGLAAAGVLYMDKLAQTLYDSINTNVLGKGATAVAVLNIPDITLTPRFQQVLAGVALANGGGAMGQAARDGVQAAVRAWISAFNSRLKTAINNDTRIAQVDFYTDFTDEVNNASGYGLTDAATPACPVTGSSGGLPTYDFLTCTSAALDGIPPTGVGSGGGLKPGWWNAYAFSDNFHPTPYGHQLLANSVNRALARAGFL